MRVGVTGASGFIGSHVVDALVDDGHEVAVIDLRAPHRPDVEHREASILDSAQMDKAAAGLDALFHLAAVADVNDVVADPAAAIELNVTGTVRALEAARKNNVKRFLLASTVWVYSSIPPMDGDTVDETADFDAGAVRHVYTTSKVAAEFLCHDYWNMHKLPFTVLRYGIPYGPRMRFSLVVPVFVRKALKGEALTLTGDGSQHRKFVYVEDLARAHVLALRPEAENQTYNLDGAEKVTIRRIAETVLQLTGAERPIEFMPARAGDYAGKDVVSDKAAKELGWVPQIDFNEGMKRTVPWLIERIRAEEGAAAASPR
jgi:UDP-glucose 4-epimerase